MKFNKTENPEDARYVFIDLETGGLDDVIIDGKMGCQYYPILQIAVIVTDGYYRELSEPLNIVIKQNESTLKNRLSEWSKEQFKDTLVPKCLSSKTSIVAAQRMVLEYLDGLGIDKRKAYLAGNSIRLDRNFIAAQMPDLNQHLHYRQLDISSLKLYFSNQYGDRAYMPKKTSHDALSDIRESVDELRFYNGILKEDAGINKKVEKKINPKPL